MLKRGGRPPEQMPIVVIGAGRGERAERCTEAAIAAGFSAPVLFSWAELLHRPDLIEQALGRNGPVLLRLDAHDGDFDSWLALAEAGASGIAASGEAPLERMRLDALREDPGLFWRDDLRLMHRQTHLGLLRLVSVAAEAARRTDAILLNDPDAVAICSDKSQCHHLMLELGMSAPPALQPDAPTFESLLEAMRLHGFARVFVKPRYGSSAAGIVALAQSPQGRLAAWSPAEIVWSGNRATIWSVKKLRQFQDRNDIAALVTAVLKSDGHVEAWIPKAGQDGKICDLRLLTIGGEPQHVVLRQASGPVTNLHLGASRGDANALIERLGEGVWQSVLDEARRFSARFPSALHLGLDVAIEANLRRHRFLEANAFGDLIRRVTHEGRDAYAAQFAALPRWLDSRPVPAM